MSRRTRLASLSAAAVALISTLPIAAGQGRIVTGPLHVQVAHSQRYGDYLTNGKGLALYVGVIPGKSADANGNGSKPVATCTATCLHLWPAASTDGSPVAGKGVQPGKLSTVKGPDNSTQVSYAGWPLYYFAADVAKGDTRGQGIKPPVGAALGAAWYLIAPDGSVILEKPPQR